MRTKNIVLFAILIILGALYIVYFTEFFAKPVIGISARPRVERSRQGTEQRGVTFKFDSKCELTEVKVISLSEFETNKYARAYWHLFSETNSIPVSGIIYGENVRGMKPKIPKMKAEALVPGVKYRLTIQAGKRTGQTDFEIPGRVTR